MRRNLKWALILIPLAIVGIAMEGAGCTTSVEPISSPLADAGPPIVDSGMRTSDADNDAAPAPREAGTGVMDSGDAEATGECASHSLAFDLTVDATGPVYYGGPQPPWLDSFGCPSWLAISPAGEGPLNLQKGGCFVACPAFTPQPAMAQSFTWDGTYYPAQSTYDASACGGLPSCACQVPSCAPSGNYVATICAGYAGGEGGTEPAPTCKQVPFTWPPTSANQSIDASITPTPDGG
jgi:hypothetical protein